MIIVQLIPNVQGACTQEPTNDTSRPNSPTIHPTTYQFWFRDWFVLGTRTFREGGVMIRWFGPLGRVWEPTIMPLNYFVLSVVVS